MRIAVLIVGILGSLGAGVLGAKWLMDYNENKEQVEQLRKIGGKLLSAKFDELDRRVHAAYALLGALVVGLAASVLAATGRGPVAGVLMLVATAVPAFFAPETLVFTFLLGIAGLLAFFARKKPAEPRAARRPVAMVR